MDDDEGRRAIVEWRSGWVADDVIRGGGMLSILIASGKIKDLEWLLLAHPAFIGDCAELCLDEKGKSRSSKGSGSRVECHGVTTETSTS